MDEYLLRLGTDEEIEGAGFSRFLETYVVDIKTLLKVVEALKSKLHTDTLENDFFEPLRKYIDRHKPTVPQLLRLSHVMCSNCNIYKTSSPDDWVDNNPELFETDVSFFYRFFRFFQIKNDAPSYPLYHIFLQDEKPYPIIEQTAKEKLKIFNTIIKYYPVCCTLWANTAGG